MAETTIPALCKRKLRTHDSLIVDCVQSELIDDSKAFGLRNVDWENSRSGGKTREYILLYAVNRDTDLYTLMRFPATLIT